MVALVAASIVVAVGAVVVVFRSPFIFDRFFLNRDQIGVIRSPQGPNSPQSSFYRLSQKYSLSPGTIDLYSH